MNFDALFIKKRQTDGECKLNNNFSIKIPSFHSFNLFYCSAASNLGRGKMDFIFSLSYFEQNLSFICHVNQFVVHKYIFSSTYIVALHSSSFFFLVVISLIWLWRWSNGTNAWIVLNTNLTTSEAHKNSSGQLSAVVRIPCHSNGNKMSKMLTCNKCTRIKYC